MGRKRISSLLEPRFPNFAFRLAYEPHSKLSNLNRGEIGFKGEKKGGESNPLYKVGFHLSLSPPHHHPHKRKEKERETPKESWLSLKAALIASDLATPQPRERKKNRVEQGGGVCPKV